MEECSWASLGSGSSRAHPLPQSRGEPGATHPHTHCALKFYAEEHHVGAKRFYGHTFGLHIGVLGRKKASCPFLGGAAYLAAATAPHPLCQGMQGPFLPALHSSSLKQTNTPTPQKKTTTHNNKQNHHKPNNNNIHEPQLLRRQFLTFIPQLICHTMTNATVVCNRRETWCGEKSQLPVKQLVFNEL